MGTFFFSVVIVDLKIVVLKLSRKAFTFRMKKICNDRYLFRFRRRCRCCRFQNRHVNVVTQSICILHLNILRRLVPFFPSSSSSLSFAQHHRRLVTTIIYDNNEDEQKKGTNRCKVFT